MTQETRYCNDADAIALQRSGWTIMWDALALTHHGAYSKHIAYRDLPEDDIVIHPDAQGALA
jgi:hypothetical protein